MSHVLIVDDNANQSAMVAALLRHAGHDAECAESAKEAVSCLRRREADLVLLDLEMPRVDGLDLLHALTTEPRFDAVRVIVYSGRTDPDAFAAAKRLGACDFIIKGDDAREALSRILSHLDAPGCLGTATTTPMQHQHAAPGHSFA